MNHIAEMLNQIARERPVGTTPNETICDFIMQEAAQAGFEIEALPFNCTLWEKGPSFVCAAQERLEVYPSPFSRPYSGPGEICEVRNTAELESLGIAGKIVLLRGEIAANALMSKDFPFYYPDEDKRIIDLLEAGRPAAVIAATGKNPMCGLSPFPLFEDGNFTIPSCYIHESIAERFPEGTRVEMRIDSETKPSTARQIIATRRAGREAAGRIVVCAHMDTKYGTPGALDNAAGVTVLIRAMRMLGQYKGACGIDIVPFNGEEYYEVSGEMAYLSHIGSDIESVRLVVNIDSPCAVGSDIAVSSYNLNGELMELLEAELSRTGVVKGPEWYSGDHAPYVAQGIPCVVLSSSNLFDTVMAVTHTPNDTADLVDIGMVDRAADFTAGLILAAAQRG